MNVIISQQASLDGLKLRSLKRPDAIFVCATSSLVARNGVVVKLGSVPHRMLLRIIASAPSPNTVTELFEAAYCERPDGGPDDVQKVVHLKIREIRAAAAALGFVIAREGHRGYFAREVTESINAN